MHWRRIDHSVAIGVKTQEINASLKHDMLFGVYSFLVTNGALFAQKIRA